MADTNPLDAYLYDKRLWYEHPDPEIEEEDDDETD